MPLVSGEDSPRLGAHCSGCSVDRSGDMGPFGIAQGAIEYATLQITADKRRSYGSMDILAPWSGPAIARESPILTWREAKRSPRSFDQESARAAHRIDQGSAGHPTRSAQQ